MIHARIGSMATRDALRRCRVYAAATRRVATALDVERRHAARLVAEGAVLERRARQRLTAAIECKAISELKRVHFPMLMLKRSSSSATRAARGGTLGAGAKAAASSTKFSEFVRANHAAGVTLDELSGRWRLLSVSEKAKFCPRKRHLQQASAAVSDAVLALAAAGPPNARQSPCAVATDAASGAVDTLVANVNATPLALPCNDDERAAFRRFVEVGFQELHGCLGPSAVTREQWCVIAPFNWESMTEKERMIYSA
jgi:hypothetical protein